MEIKRKLPRKINLFGWEREVELVDEFEDSGEDVYLGTTDFLTGKIQIRKKMSPERKWITLLHEVIHCLDIKDELSEEIVTELSWGIFAFLRDNRFL